MTSTQLRVGPVEHVSGVVSPASADVGDAAVSFFVDEHAAAMIMESAAQRAIDITASVSASSRKR